MKKKTTLTIEENLIMLAKKKGINISNFVEQVLNKVVYDDNKINKKALELASTCVSCNEKFPLEHLTGIEWVNYDEQDKMLLYDCYCRSCGNIKGQYGSIFDGMIKSKDKLVDGNGVLKALIKYFYNEKLEEELKKLS